MESFEGRNELDPGGQGQTSNTFTTCWFMGQLDHLVQFSSFFWHWSQVASV